MRLSATSALVLLWAGREHLTGRRAAAYLDGLDLAEGRGLLASCDALCPYYAEVIRNRKRGVRDLVAKILDEGAASQIVIAGAGLDPLGIDLAEAHPGIPVFEVDRDNMELKARIAGHAGASAGTGADPAFVAADLTDVAAVSRALRARGWKPNQSTLLVLEGISYYLDPAELRALAEALDPGKIVVEYLKPEAAILPARAHVPAEVFGTIAGECGLRKVHRHDAEGMARLLGMSVRTRYGMKTLERLRTRGNRHFPEENSGWIEVALLEAGRRGGAAGV